LNTASNETHLTATSANLWLCEHSIAMVVNPLV
jgi:hypothetical protein